MPVGSSRAPRELTTQERRFVEELPTCGFNVAEAARRAGYAEQDAKNSGYRLMRRARVQAALLAHLSTLTATSALTSQGVIAETDLLATSDLGRLFDLTADELRLLPMREWPEEARRAVASVKVRCYPEKLPPLGSADFDRLDRLAGADAAPLTADDRAFLTRVAGALREVAWGHYEVVELKLWDKNSALEKAAKLRGLFVELHADVSLEEYLKRRHERRMAANDAEAA